MSAVMPERPVDQTPPRLDTLVTLDYYEGLRFFTALAEFAPKDGAPIPAKVYTPEGGGLGFMVTDRYTAASLEVDAHNPGSKREPMVNLTRTAWARPRFVAVPQPNLDAATAWEAFVHPDDLARVPAALRAAARGSSRKYLRVDVTPQNGDLAVRCNGVTITLVGCAYKWPDLGAILAEIDNRPADAPRVKTWAFQPRFLARLSKLSDHPWVVTDLAPEDSPAKPFRLRPAPGYRPKRCWAIVMPVRVSE